MRRTTLLIIFSACATSGAKPASGADLADVVVLATRTAEASLEVPASISRVDGAALRAGLGVNLSESLGPVPGISIQNRGNYAQDLQVSIRGFGARSSFGARGIRLYADGIPATMPDGQGQYSHFDLSGADRIEILRGPFSALYGNSAGGVIAITTADAPLGGMTEATLEGGSLGTHRYVLRDGGSNGTLNYTIDAAHFATEGYRDHSHAERNTANAKLHVDLSPETRLTLVANAIGMPPVDDPLGLTAAQVAANPAQAGSNSLLYNTRKSLAQEQFGATLQTQLSAADELTLTAYAGHRHSTQFQSILKSIELASSTHPGGIIDLGRDYRGGEMRLTDRRTPGGTPLSWTLGASYDALDESRRGYLNFVGTDLGIFGALRRNDGNQVRAFDQYLQLEWDATARLRAIAGMRHSEVRVESRNHLAIDGPLTTVRYAGSNPVAGIMFKVREGLSAYASYGRGFETPTLNDIAYRSTSGNDPGLNTSLRPAQSENYELGVKARSEHMRGSLAAFYIRTENELAVQANSGGRSVLENIGPTERKGAEASLEVDLAARTTGTLAYTYLHAATLATYTACAVTPCVPLPVPAGSHLPAVPENALYAGLTWRSIGAGVSATAETIVRIDLYADDRNTAVAAGYWTTNLRLGLTQDAGRWTLTETARLDNLFDRRYIGTVIVNETNSRFYEPSPGRTAYLIITVRHH